MSATLETVRTAQAAQGGNDSLLLFILSVLAGLVDVIGFLRLDHLFTAHITGNLVVMADQVANGGPPHVAQLLSIPVFAAAVVARSKEVETAKRLITFLVSEQAFAAIQSGGMEPLGARRR